jgi:hypothetical protein
MCGRRNKEEIGKFSVKDAENYEKYEEELAKFVEAVDSLLGTLWRDSPFINVQ